MRFMFLLQAQAGNKLIFVMWLIPVIVIVMIFVFIFKAGQWYGQSKNKKKE